MASIKLKSNQEVVLRLKACGLTNSEIKKIMEALTPMIEEKADKATTLSGYGIEDAYNKDEVDDKIKQVSIKEVEYSDIDNIIESGVYKLMDGEGTTMQGDGMWLVVSRTSDPIDSVIYVIQYMFSSATGEIKSRTRNPMDGVWFEWESIGSGGNKDFIVNFTIDENMNCTSDKTFEEVQAAIQDGYNLYAITEAIQDGELVNVKFPLTFFSDVNCVFSGICAYTSYYVIMHQNGECYASIQGLVDTGIYDTLKLKAASNLENVSNEDFLNKLNEVLPDGDEVSY